MANYATVGDVQARFPQQILTIGADNQPTVQQVNDLIEQQTLWVNSLLDWKYTTPVTDASDLKLLRPVVTALVASQLWQLIEGYGDGNDRSDSLRKEALSMLAYDAKAGRGMLVLPGTALADTGEAAVGQPMSTFTDPEVCGDQPRLFTIGMEL